MRVAAVDEDDDDGKSSSHSNRDRAKDEPLDGAAERLRCSLQPQEIIIMIRINRARDLQVKQTAKVMLS